ncbi:hypothetical protein B0T25DRAFT_98313 [Lasiosphaeria hispida]|uniref:Uncharacterized protein n=1 Tax=Lasiosphaeria hispida TaxID=260671 RepID=A0AAJ0HQG9_9PEZI|nr:hypothetical protein B0T25DRAFT_98313 [Lasiosphaeria hispida]
MLPHHPCSPMRPHADPCRLLSMPSHSGGNGVHGGIHVLGRVVTFVGALFDVHCRLSVVRLAQQAKQPKIKQKDTSYELHATSNGRWTTAARLAAPAKLRPSSESYPICLGNLSSGGRLLRACRLHEAALSTSASHGSHGFPILLLPRAVVFWRLISPHNSDSDNTPGWGAESGDRPRGEHATSSDRDPVATCRPRGSRFRL